MITRKQLISFWPDVLGVLGLFLPFVGVVSPFDVLANREYWYFFDIFPFGNKEVFWPGLSLSGPASLAIPIAAWQVVRVWRGTPGKIELTLAYIFSASAMLATVSLSVFAVEALYVDDPDYIATLWAVSAGLSVALIATNVLLIRYNLKIGKPAEITASVFLLGGYLPSAIVGLLCLSPFFILWGVGAFLVFGASIGYVARIPNLMRHGTKAYRPEEGSG